MIISEKVHNHASAYPQLIGTPEYLLLFSIILVCLSKKNSKINAR